MSLERKSPRCHGCRKYLVEDPKLEPKENEIKILKKCTKCKMAKYCDRKCQIDDWNSHKKFCKHVSILLQEINEIGVPGKEKEHVPIPKIFKGRFQSDAVMTGEEFAIIMTLIYKKFELAYAMWHLAEVYECYDLYQQFYYQSVEISNMGVAGDFASYTTIRYYMVMALMAMGRFSDAYDTIKFWMMNNFLSGKDIKAGEYTIKWKKFEKHRQFRYINQDRNENIIEMIYKNKPLDSIYSEQTQEEWYVRQNIGPFMPALIAIKIHNLLEMEQRHKDFLNFIKAIETDNGGLLSQWNVRYPIVIDNIAAMLLGYKNSVTKLKNWKLRTTESGYRNHADKNAFLQNIDNQRDDLMMYVASCQFFFFSGYKDAEKNWLFTSTNEKDSGVESPFTGSTRHYESIILNSDDVADNMYLAKDTPLAAVWYIGRPDDPNLSYPWLQDLYKLATNSSSRRYFIRLFRDKPEIIYWTKNMWYNDWFWGGQVCTPRNALDQDDTEGPGRFSKFDRASWKLGWHDKFTWQLGEGCTDKPSHLLITPWSQYMHLHTSDWDY